MKNQYVGDIGDYGKYGLLRFFRQADITVGVNWYLTPDDGRSDGNHTEYLSDPRMRVYDPALYDAIGRFAFSPDKHVSQIESSGLLDGVRFYHAQMNFAALPWRERAAARGSWHRDALAVLTDAELLFADPDNSLSVTVSASKKNAEKYILPAEISDYYQRGQQIVYYHHQSRKSLADWTAEKRQILRFLPNAGLLAVSFHRWTSRTYIFVVHPDKYNDYRKLLEQFLASPWGSHCVDGKAAFTSEPV